MRRLAVAVGVAGCLLLAALPAAGAASAVGYTPVGTQIVGGTSAADGPLLAPGQYVDTFARGGASVAGKGSSRYYTIDLKKGETGYLSVTMLAPDERTNLTALEADIALSNLEQSGSCLIDTYAQQSENDGRTGQVSATLSTGVVGGASWPPDCPSGGVFAVKVTRSGDAYRERVLTAEVGLHIEPPASTAGLPPAASSAHNLNAIPHGDRQSATAGSSFDNATLLRTGTYTSKLAQGQSGFFRVHLQWGQRLAYLMTSGNSAAGAGETGVEVQTRLANPMRSPLLDPIGADDTSPFFGSEDVRLYSSTLAPVRYRNRSSADSDVRDYAIDGDYYLIIFTGFPKAGSAARTVPYTVVVDVSGTIEAAPTYQVAAGGATSASSAPPPVADSGQTTGLLTAGGVAIVVLAGAGVAALTLRRRARPRAGPGHAPTSAMSVPPHVPPRS